MCGDAVHTAQMAVIVADDLVVLQVPALDSLVLTAGEEVRRPGGDGHSAHCVRVAGQRELQRAGGQVPDLVSSG